MSVSIFKVEYKSISGDIQMANFLDARLPQPEMQTTYYLPYPDDDEAKEILEDCPNGLKEQLRVMITLHGGNDLVISW